MKKFTKYPNLRRADWEYARNGIYFITINTLYKEKYFGQIQGTKVILNEIGKIAKYNLIDMQDHFQNISLDKFIIMPNHIHAIIIISGKRPWSVSKPPPRVSATSMPKESLSLAINQYKGAVKRYCNKNGFEYFKWQSRF